MRTLVRICTQVSIRLRSPAENASKGQAYFYNDNDLMSTSSCWGQRLKPCLSNISAYPGANSNTNEHSSQKRVVKSSLQLAQDTFSHRRNWCFYAGQWVKPGPWSFFPIPDRQKNGKEGLQRNSIHQGKCKKLASKVNGKLTNYASDQPMMEDETN